KNRQIIVERSSGHAGFLAMVTKCPHIGARDRQDVQVGFWTEEIEKLALDLLVLLCRMFVLRFGFDLRDMFKPLPDIEPAQPSPFTLCKISLKRSRVRCSVSTPRRASFAALCKACAISSALFLEVSPVDFLRRRPNGSV